MGRLGPWWQQMVQDCLEGRDHGTALLSAATEEAAKLRDATRLWPRVALQR